MNPRGTLGIQIVGAFLFTVTLAALYFIGKAGMDTGPIFYIAGPVISAIFLAPGINSAADAAKQAALQTNGSLKPAVKSAVAEAISEQVPDIVKSASSAALADRDAARTRQAQGDISQDYHGASS
jgi:hypothetical protein